MGYVLYSWDNKWKVTHGKKRYNNKDKYTCRNALHYRTEERFTRSW